MKVIGGVNRYSNQVNRKANSNQVDRKANRQVRGTGEQIKYGSNWKSQ